MASGSHLHGCDKLDCYYCRYHNSETPFKSELFQFESNVKIRQQAEVEMILNLAKLRTKNK